MTVSSFREDKLAAGAVFEQIRGMEAAAHYGDTASEYASVREAAGLVDRSHRGHLLVTGSDRARFLHGMLSNTVEGLETGAGNYATMTTPRGQTLTDVWVYRRAEGFLLETEPGLQGKLMASLDRYLVADDVDIEDVTGAEATLGVHGPGSRLLIARVLGEVPVDLADCHTVLRSLGGADVSVTARGYTGERGYDLRIVAVMARRLWSALTTAGARPVGDRALEALRIEAGIPRYGVDVDERVVPLEAGLDHAVDFAKGCFIGQETIAKMHNLGKPRRYLVGLRLDTETVPSAETPLRDGERQIGWITSGLYSPALRRVVSLASVRRGFERPGRMLSVDGGGRAEVVELPFLRR
jgi:aminomethyltransferase